MYRIRDADDDDPATQYVRDPTGRSPRPWGRRYEAHEFTASEVVKFIAAFEFFRVVAEPADER